MSVIVPIERIRLGNSEVETPGLTLKVTNVLRACYGEKTPCLAS